MCVCIGVGCVHSNYEEIGYVLILFVSGTVKMAVDSDTEKVNSRVEDIQKRIEAGRKLANFLGD